MKKSLILTLIVLTLLAGCRNETQNRLRRNIQDFANTRMYITLYSRDGGELFNGIVDGKVTRAVADPADASGGTGGGYIFWYDERGRYHQSDLPYLVTTYDRHAEPEFDQ